MINQDLRHLALILDGNRRWGKQRGLAMSIDFYVRSGLLGREVAQAAFDRGVNNLTIWVGSVANLTKRPTLEIKALNRAYTKFFADAGNLEFLRERQVRVDCFGRWRDLLESSTIDAIEKTLETTKDYNSGKCLTILIGYDGADERGAAVLKVLEDQAKLLSSRDPKTWPSGLPESHSDPARSVSSEIATEPSLDDLVQAANLLRKNSWTGHLPDVDLIIRTGCADDPHNSAGFLSLLVDHTQYAFLETLWPDFTPEMLYQEVDRFAERERRMGK
ncbi:MAG: undecaprenyl diphosphate synthase family protein [Sphaerimonospora mesophila]